VAYNLARLLNRHGVGKRIVVLDRGYLCGGASGRNGGGVRAQWSSETNVRLMLESLEICKSFASEHRINTWFRQGGYLFVARSPEKVEMLRNSAELQRGCGLETRLLEPREVKRVVPELDTDQIGIASYNPKDAVVFPWPFVWGYAEGAQALGAEIHTFTEVVAIETNGKNIRKVITTKGEVEAELVINAAGAHSPEVAKLVGVELPNHPHRHEICASEPLKPWLTPLVADLENGLYFSQSTRGEIVGGVGNEQVPEGPDQSSSARFLALYSRALTRLCPAVARVKVLRQWAGLYDLTPDANPIVGEVDELPGFFQLSGFMGHGFMMAPVMGKLVAEHLVTGAQQPLFERWNPRRFRQGQLLSEGMIIG
ncbi:MAG: FAD-binding oxidoreductase, partial [Myxococcales bacterium]|nr:FAD-binding oxidoreductase [Myxococcales bacterium]